MTKAEKIKKIKASEKVRPPKAWWKRVREEVSDQYPTYSEKRIDRITAGIWHKMTKSQQIAVIQNPKKKRKKEKKGFLDWLFDIDI